MSEIENLDSLIGAVPDTRVPAPRQAPTTREQTRERGFSSAPDRNTLHEDDVSARAEQRLKVGAVVLGASVLLGLIGVGFLKGQNSAGWSIAASLAIAAIALLYKKFEAGIALFISVCWIAVKTPEVVTGGSGMSQGIPVSQAGLLLLLFVWVTKMIVLRRPAQPGISKAVIYPTPLNVPILLFLTICCWSTLNSLLLPDPAVKRQLGGIIQDVASHYTQINIVEIVFRVLALGGLLMIGNTLRGRELRWASLAILAPGVITYTGVLSFLPTSIFMAFPQILSIALLAGLFVAKRGSLPVRLVAAGIALTMLCSFVFKGTAWASGWMGALTALAVILWVGNRRLFFAGLAVFVVIVASNYSYFHKVAFTDNVTGSDADRFSMLTGGMRYAAKFPLGIGLGNYRTYNSYYGRKDVWNTTTYTSAHGTYSQTLSELGWPGLISFVLLLGAGTRMLYGVYKRLPPSFEKGYALGALGGFVGIYVASFAGDYMFPAYYNGGMSSFGACVFTFLMIGVVMAMARERGIVWSDKTAAIQPQFEPPTPTPAQPAPPSPSQRPQPVFNRPLRPQTSEMREG